MQVGEDHDLAVPARMDLSKLLNLESKRSITNITELSLTAARYKADMMQPRSWLAGDMISKAATTIAAAAPETAAAVTGEVFRPARQLLLQQQEQQHYQMHADTSISSAVAQQMQACWGDACTCRDCLFQTSSKGSSKQASRLAAAAVRETYDIWEHPGDQLPVIEIYPMEIRSFEITLTSAC